MKVEDCFPIGTVARAHGLKGEVTLLLERDFAFDISFPSPLFLAEKDQLVPYFVSHSSVKGSKAYVKLEEVDTHEQAKALARSRVYLPKTMRPSPGKNAFYDDEVSGFEVHDREFGILGRVEGVVRSGSQRLLSIGGEKEILIPVDAPFIQRIDRRKQLIQVVLPEGYLDI